MSVNLDRVSADLALIHAYIRRTDDIFTYLDGKSDIDLDNEILDLYIKIGDIRNSICRLEY